MLGVALGVHAEPKMRYDRWFNHYHDSIVYKIFLKHKTSADTVTTVEQAIEIAKRIHDYSGGIHQIAYLVGWNSDGHDSKYPDFLPVGDQCRSSLSDDPAESIRLAMKAVQKYNADMSLHICMNDAYTNAPSWQTYVDNDLICRNKDGSLLRGGVFGGEQSYRISHVKEFKKGFAQKRILQLLETFPDLKRSGTVHIDAFFGQPSEYEGISTLDDFKAVCAITDFWHSQCVDVTTEFIGSRKHVGMFPMCYHLNMDEQMQLEVPPTLLCGGGDLWNARSRYDYYNTKDSFFTMWLAPSAGAAYPEAWGVGSLRGDLDRRCLSDPHALIDRLFSAGLIFCYYNKSMPVKHWEDARVYVVERANGVVASVRKSDRRLEVKDNGRLVLDGGDCLLDFPHRGGTFLAYSREGCDREYVLPQTFAGARFLKGTQWPEGMSVRIPVTNGTVRVSLPKRSSLVLWPMPKK